MSANAVRHGILGLGGAEWAVIALGAVLLAPEKVAQLVRPAFDALLSAAPTANNVSSTRAPIVIHTGGGQARSNVTTIVTYAMGAGCVWVSYTIFSNCLPDYVKELLPVTRKFFDQATTKLAEGIYNVKDILGKQILSLSKKQDDLSKKQDATHVEVVEIKDELGEARGDLSKLNASMDRCEMTLEDSRRLQSYTARGVKLLTRSVASILPGDDSIFSELAQYSKDGEEFRQQLGSSQTRVKRSDSSPAVARPPTNPQEQTPIQPENEHPSISFLRKESGDSMNGLNDLIGLIRDGKIAVQ